ncbi:MAG: undecaprenyl diphosphate synthase family protein, partial [Thermodesulfobacteriota bacterium]|nr:undecaprenyl diphosphate synthase family protein [Thermodesulfobacteriota bacterium]
MDGNGRWAQKRGLPRRKGHAAGADAAKALVTECRTLGIEYVTLYTFSKENWDR